MSQIIGASSVAELKALFINGYPGGVTGKYISFSYGDMCIVFLSNWNVYFYIWDSTSTATGNDTTVVNPTWTSTGVSHTGTGRWILASVTGAATVTTVTTVTTSTVTTVTTVTTSTGTTATTSTVTTVTTTVTTVTTSTATTSTATTVTTTVTTVTTVTTSTVTTTTIANTNFLIDTHIIGAWNWEDNYLDQTSNDFDLTASGTPDFETGTGVHWGSKSLHFAAQEYVFRAALDLPTGFPGTVGYLNAISVGGWFRFDTLLSGVLDYIQLMAKDFAGAGHSWYLQITGTTNRVQFGYEWGAYPSWGICTASSVDLAEDTDYFICATWDGATITLYLGTTGGAPQVIGTASATHAMSSTLGEFTIGNNFNGVSYNKPFVGWTDMNFLFNDCLSSDEVLEIWTHKIDGSG